MSFCSFYFFPIFQVTTKPWKIFINFDKMKISLSRNFHSRIKFLLRDGLIHVFQTIERFEKILLEHLREQGNRTKKKTE